MQTRLIVCLLLLATGLGWSDQLYIRNRPFKGRVSAVGKNLSSIRIDLNDLCTAADLKVSAVGENWVVHKSGETPSLPEAAEGLVGRLFAATKEIHFSEEEGRKWVSLQDFSNAWGARLSYNASTQSVDLNFVPTGVAQTSSGERKPSNVPAYAPPSKYRLVAFGATW